MAAAARAAAARAAGAPLPLPQHALEAQSEVQRRAAAAAAAAAADEGAASGARGRSASDSSYDFGGDSDAPTGTAAREEGAAMAAPQAPKFNHLATKLPDASYESDQKWHRVAAYAAIVAYVVVAACAAILAGLLFPIALPVVVIVAGAGILLPIKIFQTQMGKAENIENEAAAEEKFVQAKLNEWKQPSIARSSHELISTLREQAKTLEDTPDDKLLRRTPEDGTQFEDSLHVTQASLALFRETCEASFVSAMQGLKGDKAEALDTAIKTFQATAGKSLENIFKTEKPSKEAIEATRKAMLESAETLEKALADLMAAHDWKAPSFDELVNVHAKELSQMGARPIQFFYRNSGGSSKLVQLQDSGVNLQQFQPLFARLLFWNSKVAKVAKVVEELEQKEADKSKALREVKANLAKNPALQLDELSKLLEKRNSLMRQVNELKFQISQLKYQMAHDKINAALNLMILENPTCLFDTTQAVKPYPVEASMIDTEELYRLCTGPGLTLENVTGRSTKNLSDLFFEEINRHQAEVAKREEATQLAAEARARQASASAPTGKRTELGAAVAAAAATV